MTRPDGRASARKSFVFLVMGTVVRTVWCIPVIFFLCSFSSADVPHMINYQGKLTTASGGCLNDTVQMTFSIYPDTLGSPADWTETQTEVVVKEGIFNVLLGAVDTIPSAVFDGSIKYLGVQVESDPEMTPLKPMVSVAYAYRAGAVDGGPSSGWVDDGTVVRLADSTDQVGIGTSDPHVNAKLHLKRDPSVYISFDHGRDTIWHVGSNAISNQNFQITQGDPYGYVVRARIQVNGDVSFGETGGKVGVGTSSPREKLDVAESFGGALAITNLHGYIEAGDTLGEIKFYGHDGGEQVGAEIIASTSEEWTPGSSGGDLHFLTTPAGSSTPMERVLISDEGDVGIGTAAPAAKLHVDGDIRADSVYRIRGVPVLAISDTVNTFVGPFAGEDNSGNNCTFVGWSAGSGGNQGDGNTFVGQQAGHFNTLGHGNTFLGRFSGRQSTTGSLNTFLGAGAGGEDSSGSSNTFVGFAAGSYIATGSYNTFIGRAAGGFNSEGNNNIFVGYHAGYYSAGSGNIFIGNEAGWYETGSDKLYIANGRDTSDVLIYGEFSTDRVGINTLTPTEELHVVGDIYCTGKMTSDGGYDPPYVLYDKESRKAIVERVAKEVPEEKLDGAVLFWNGDDSRFEVYLPAKGEFRDLLGNLLATVDDLKAAR